jgi:hypothetical protein
VRAISVREATDSHLCKKPNCDRLAISTRGPYALLCSMHTAIAKEELSEVRRASHAARKAPKTPPVARLREKTTNAATALRELADILDEIAAAVERARS